MSVVSLGFAEILIVLGLGGGLGLPVGIPPGPEDPLLANVAPQECLFYTSWAGMAKPDPGSENQTEQLLAEAEVQHLLAELQERITAVFRQTAKREGPEAETLAGDMVDWAKTLLTHPTTLFLSSAKMTPTGPEIQGGGMVRIGEDAAKLKATLEKYQTIFLREAAEEVQIDGDTWYRLKLGPGAPVITWGVKKSYLLLGVGDGAVESMLKRARTPAPEWLTKIEKQLPIDRRATVTFVNLEAIIDTFAPMAGEPRIQQTLDAIGLENVTSLISVTGLDKEGFVSRTLVGLDGEPQGLLGVVVGKPLQPQDLAPIPSDATVAVAARLDTNAVLETFLSVVQNVEPTAAAEIAQGFQSIERALGFSIRDDVLKSLGDTWCVYNSPGEGGLAITGLTAVVPVKDRRRLDDAHKKWLALMKAEMEPDQGRRRGPRIEQFQFAGQDVYFLDVRSSEFLVAPAWCLTEKELVVTTFPQNIKAYLSRGKEYQSLAKAPAVAGLFASGDGPVMLSYTDTRKLFELIYPLAPIAAQMVFGELSREGIDLDVSILPSAPSIARHLRPTIAAVRRSEGGIELIGRQSVPGGSIGAAVPVAAGLLFPAVSAAREAARRAQSMNNLKQIGLAMLNHQAALKRFPPAYTTDKDGKPLLSWRVQILPYLGAKQLYDKFHFDEPWDSEHNKKLISQMPKTYQAPGSKAGEGKTNYLTVRGKDTAFPGKDKIVIRDIRDGTSRTIMTVEAGDAKAVIWTKPDDYKYDEKKPAAGLVGLRRGGFNVGFCDGSVHFLARSVDKDVLKALFTRNGGEKINVGDF